MNNLTILKEVINNFPFLEAYKESLREIEEKLSKGEVIVVFTGEFSSGKTSLLNVLFGLNLPTDVLPKTSSIWEIKYGDTPNVVVHLKDGFTKIFETIDEVEKIPPEQIEYIELFTPNSEKNITIVDSPGLSSIDEHHSKILNNYIDKADVLFVVIDINQGLTKTTKEFIEKQLESGVTTYLILNKIDTKPPSTVKKLKEFLLKKYPNLVENIVSASAKKKQIDEVLAVINKLKEEKEEILKRRISVKIKNLCHSIKANIQFQLKNLELDLSDIIAKEREIENELRKLSLEFEELKVELERKLLESIDKTAEIFKNYLINNLDYIIKALYDENLEESLQDRFNKVIKEAHQKAVAYLQKELKAISEYVESSISHILTKYNVENDFAIIITDLIVRFRELIFTVISALLTRLPIPAIGKFITVIVNQIPIVRELFNTILMGFSKSFVRKKLIEAIDQITLEYKKLLKENLTAEFDKIFNEFSKELREKEKSLKKALEDLRIEKTKKIQEFNEYKQKLELYLNKLNQICTN
jgi:predicted GTPase